MSTLFGYEVVEQAQEIDRLSTEIASLTAENERLRALVTSAYSEGWEDSKGWRTRDMTWDISNTRAALQPKEEDQ